MPLRRCASKISESNIEMGGEGVLIWRVGDQTAPQLTFLNTEVSEFSRISQFYHNIDPYMLKVAEQKTIINLASEMTRDLLIYIIHQSVANSIKGCGGTSP